MPREKSSTCRKPKKSGLGKKRGIMETYLLGEMFYFSGGINDAAGPECATVHPVGGHLPRV